MPIDLKKHIVDALNEVAELWAKDLRAHRDPEIATPMSPTARSVADLTYETILVNRRFAARLRGEAPPSMDGFPAAPEGLRTGAALADAMRESIDGIVAAYDDPEREIPATGGGTVTAFELCGFAITHSYYHLGQVDYVQTVYGDTEVHWMA